MPMSSHTWTTVGSLGMKGTCIRRVTHEKSDPSHPCLDRHHLRHHLGSAYAPEARADQSAFAAAVSELRAHRCGGGPDRGPYREHQHQWFRVGYGHERECESRRPCPTRTSALLTGRP